MALDVLVVDDSAAIRKILSRVLKASDLGVNEVHEAADGEEALKMLESKSVNLILSDINMPNMDGLQLLERVKASGLWKDLPFIMISTEGGATKVMEAVEKGATGYVKKPFTADQIKEKLVGVV
jgi:two-component system, chemotaxis family, chemotaxis protein CheY